MKREEKKTVIESFIENRKEIIKGYEELRNVLDSITPDTPFISNATEELNETVGNYGEVILETLGKTNLPKKLLEKDNSVLYNENNAMSVFGSNLLSTLPEDKPNRVIENSFFGVFEEGMCLRAANFFNITAHKLKEEEGKLGLKLKIRAVDIDDIRTNNSISGILDKATGLRAYDAYDVNFDALDEDLLNDTLDDKDENVNKIHNLMQRSGMGKKGFTKEQTRDFLKVLKINELKQTLYNSKQLAFDAMIHNLSSKTKKYNEEKRNGATKEELEEYRATVALIMCEENEKQYSIKGKKTYRICGSAEGDIHPTQFHLTEQKVNETTERLDFKIEEYDKLLEDFPVSCAVPRNEANDQKKRNYLYANSSLEDRETDTYKCFDPFGKIKLIIKKLKELAKLNVEKPKLLGDGHEGLDI